MAGEGRVGPCAPVARAGLLLGGTFAVALAFGCASDLVARPGGFEHRRHGYTLGLPPDDGTPWRRVSVEDAVLSFRRPGPVLMSLQSRCGVPLAAPRILARHLTIGFERPALRHAGPIELDGRTGWTQTFEAADAASPVRVKTVTVVCGDCIVDWILTARRGFEAAEPLFDAWWASFRSPRPPLQDDG